MAGLHNAVITYKQNILSQIINNQRLVEAINSHAASPDDLLYKNVFPFFRVPTTDTETNTYICVCIDFPEAYHPENFMRQITLKFCIIVHQDQMLTNYGATRLDYISAQLDDMFVDQPGYGYGRLSLLSSTESSLDQFHRYREIVYVSNETRSAGC